MAKSKKTKSTEKTLEPGTESKEVFSLILSLVKDLIDQNEIKIEVEDDGNLGFSLSPSKIKPIISKKIEGNLLFDNFLKILSTEIESLLNASVCSDLNKGIKDNIPSSIIKEVGIDELISRIKEIQEIINIPGDLKKDLIFKKTTKELLLNEIKWEINNKVFDDELGPLENFKYSTLSLSYSRPVTESYVARLAGEGIRIQLPVNSEPKQITFALQEKDVQNLINKLNNLLNAFGENGK